MVWKHNFGFSVYKRIRLARDGVDKQSILFSAEQKNDFLPSITFNESRLLLICLTASSSNVDSILMITIVT